MKTTIKTVVLTIIIAAAMLYIASEWAPLRSLTSSSPPARNTSNPLGVSASHRPRELTEDEKINVEVYRKCSPAVVNITTMTLSYDFFLHPVPHESGTGSGVIVDTNGHIVTNFHVIEGAAQLEVTLADKSTHAGRVVGTDPNNDLAVIKIEPATEQQLTAIPLGNSKDMQVGEKVLAIGNPYGLERTLTSGIISSVGREIEARNGRIIEDVIQTDAAVNPGNSGGPLLNGNGEMIGLNTAILSPANSGNIGIGFAVPAETIRRVAGDLITYGQVRRPYVGIQTAALSQFAGLAEGLRLNTRSGLLVISVLPDSPAAHAGIRGSSRETIVGHYRVPDGGDVILAVEGHAVESTEHLSSAIDRYVPGDRVTVTLLRDNRRVDVSLTLGENPKT